MKCVILCAGYATRLYPLTLDKPKALLPVGGKPILDYILEKVNEVKEVDEIIIVTNDKFYGNFSDWAKDKENVVVLNDGTTENGTRLGGIGDLWFSIEKENIDEDIMVVLGDNLFEENLNDVVDFFKRVKGPVVALHDLKDLEEAKKFGVLKVEGDKIISFHEKPEKPESTLVSTGIYVYPRETLKRIEDYMNTDGSKDGPGYLVSYLLGKEDVYGYLLSGSWYDIGSKETYKEVNDLWENGDDTGN